MNIEKRQSAAMLFSLLLCLEESLKADDAPAAFQYVNFRLKSFVQLSSAASVIVKTGRNAVDW